MACSARIHKTLSCSRTSLKYGILFSCVTMVMISLSVIPHQLSLHSQDAARLGQAPSLKDVVALDPANEHALEQQIRRRRLARVCERLKQGHHNSSGLDFLNDDSSLFDRSVFDNIYVDDTYKLVYCEIPKVACTNFKIVMLLLSGKMNVTDPYKLRPDRVHGEYARNYLHKLSSFSVSEIRRKLKEYFKVILVRDPLERLLSAYLNKFTVYYNDYFKLRYGRDIVKQYRSNPTKEALETGGDVTFQEFVQYLTDPKTAKSGDFNPHWKQYYKLCHPCRVQYDYIGKHETIAEDMAFLLQLLGVADRLKMPPPRRKGVKTATLMRKYYANITSEQIHTLWQIYSTDFNMFDYGYPDFAQKTSV